MNSATSLRAVLLADQDTRVREMLAACAAKLGWSVDVADDQSSGLQAVQSRNYDLIITDFNLGGGPGLDFVSQLKALKPDQALIVLSAGSTTAEVLSCLREGVADFLFKPLETDSLERSLERIANGKLALDSGARFVKEERVCFEFTSAELAELRLHPPLLDKLEKAGRIDRQARLKLELAFKEALANSLEHGNLELRSAWREEINAAGMDRYSEIKQARLQEPAFSQRLIELELRYDRCELVIRIKDQGPGFVPPDKVTVCASFDDPACHGRGIALMKTLMDEVEYGLGGRELVMRKKLQEKPRSSR